MARIGEVVRQKGPKGCLFLVDAIAGAAWLPIDVETLGADMLALAGHKLDGPKGVGALYLKKGTHILAQLQGGNQERFRRAGTEDVAAAVGMGVAFELAVAEREATVKRRAEAAGPAARGRACGRWRRAHRPPARPAAEPAVRRRRATRRAHRSWSSSTSRASPARSAPRARPARPSRRTC